MLLYCVFCTSDNKPILNLNLNLNEARSGSVYSARGVAPMDPDDPMMSCLPSGRSSRGGESLPRTQSQGSSGTVPSFDPLARAADLLQNANFLDGQGRVTLPATRDKRDELLEMLLLGLSDVESRRSHQDNPSRREESLGGGARTYVRTYGHFFRLKGRGVFPGN